MCICICIFSMIRHCMHRCTQLHSSIDIGKCIIYTCIQTHQYTHIHTYTHNYTYASYIPTYIHPYMHQSAHASIHPCIHPCMHPSIHVTRTVHVKCSVVFPFDDNTAPCDMGRKYLCSFMRDSCHLYGFTFGKEWHGKSEIKLQNPALLVNIGLRFLLPKLCTLDY